MIGRFMVAGAMLAASPAAAQHHHGDPAPAQHHDGHQPPEPAPTKADHQRHAAAAMVQAPGSCAPRSILVRSAEGDDMGVQGAQCLSTAGSGTARLPAAEGEMQGLHAMAGEWMLMAHGYAWATYSDQGGPRGDAMAFVGSMAMLGAERPIGDGGRLKLGTMLSLEPAMGQRGYPNLFATGETAHGRPLVDRQHPHDLFMELAARIDLPLGENGSIFLYGGPVGEPALGPAAFMHRASAKHLPLSPITHHWFDSTHITYGVVTAGYARPFWQVEASAFRGREPDEERWAIETPALDSWSVRATINPSQHLAAQVSYGRIKAPEPLHGGADEGRTTASLHYARGGLATTIAFSAKNRIPGDTLTAWLAESNWDIDRHHSIFGRVENVANDELFPDHHHPLHDRKFRVTKAEAGYAYRIPLGPFGLALGGTLATYAKPAALDPYYGRAPLSWTGFAKLSLGH